MYATKQLRDEHEGIKIMLAVLEHLAEVMRRDRPVRTEDLSDILDFLRIFADTCHHGKEEALLFPALIASGLPREGGPVSVMLQEHEQGRALIRGMREELQQLPDDPAAAKRFADHAVGYVNLLRAHIEKENQILFMIAETRLSAEAHAQLARDFDAIEHERIGEGVHEQYHAMIHTLRDRYLNTAA